MYGICMQVSPTPARVCVPTRGVCVAQRLTSGALSYFFETRLSLNPELNVLAGPASQPALRIHLFTSFMSQGYRPALLCLAVI